MALTLRALLARSRAGQEWSAAICSRCFSRHISPCPCAHVRVLFAVLSVAQDNGAIFSAVGKAMNKHASKNIKTCVVGNPANTNCLIAAANAPDINPANFTAMTRLDHNRLTAPSSNFQTDFL